MPADPKRVAARYRQGGTDRRVITGVGWTEREALDNALAEDEREYGHGEGYGGGWSSVREVVRTRQKRKPKPAKRVTVEKASVRKGPVKKAFVIERHWPRLPGDPASGLDRDRAFTQHYDTQGAVLKAAKGLALKYQEPLAIELKAFCQGPTRLAVLRPEKGQPGIWEFTVDFRS